MDDIELWNFYAVRAYALSKDTPARQWHEAEAMHPAIFRALRIDREESGAVYAAMPFRLHKDETGARILVALPCPRFFDPTEDYLDIETVLAWNPRTNKAVVWGDVEPHQIVGTITEAAESAHVFGDPFDFLRAYAEARAAWWEAARYEMGNPWRTFKEPDLTPGLLVVGDPAKAAWPRHIMPADIITHGIDANALNRILLRQARIPRARAANSYREAA